MFSTLQLHCEAQHRTTLPVPVPASCPRRPMKSARRHQLRRHPALPRLPFMMPSLAQLRPLLQSRKLYRIFPSYWPEQLPPTRLSPLMEPLLLHRLSFPKPPRIFATGKSPSFGTNLPQPGSRSSTLISRRPHLRCPSLTSLVSSFLSSRDLQ